MIFHFKIEEKNAKWKQGRFEIEDLRLVGEGDETTLEYGRVQAYLDDKLYKNDIVTWSCRYVTAEFMFISILNSYLRNDVDTFSFGEEWKFFEAYKTPESSEPAKTILQYDDGFKPYELLLAVPGFRYYVSCEDELMLCNDRGGVLTDMEAFFLNSLYEDVVKVIKKEMTCLYKSNDIDILIDENGGTEEFVKKFG